jgi:hypothetical protein
MHYYVRMSFGNINWNDFVKKKKATRDVLQQKTLEILYKTQINTK